MAPAASFGHWIRQRRRGLDLTQEELAVRAGCSVSAIRKIEADERRPSRQVAELLAEVLQIPNTDRPAFLKIARIELAYDHLDAIHPPDAPAPSLPLSPAGDADAAAALQNGNGRPQVRSLPTPLTPLVGRTAEVARICEILVDPECRILTLTGSGGVGKTRLAIAAAERLALNFYDGVCFVPLAAVTAGVTAGVMADDSILTAVAAALGLLHANGNLPAQLESYLQSRQLLLVLDNLEHLLEGAGSIAELVQAAPGMRVLGTSREPLGLAGEWVLEVHGLSLLMLEPPLDSGKSLDSGQGHDEGPLGWEAGGAVTLFLQAARRADPEFAPRAADYAAIAHICRLVEGSPLGIELAAAWVRPLTCREIAAEIERSYDVLATTVRDVPLRQRSLRAEFEYSWRLLPTAEQRVLRALSVFAGGFTRAAGEAVAGASLQELASLLAKSLVARTSDCRYDLHPIVRQYAAEKLELAGEADAAAGRHWSYFLRLATDADAARNSPQYMALVDGLELESANLQAALRYMVERDAGAACTLAAVLEPLWNRRPVHEAIQWLERLAAVDAPVGDPAALRARARVLYVLASLQDALADTMTVTHRALEVARQANDRRTTALALSMLGNEGLVVAGFEGSDACFAEAQRLAEEDGDKATLATVLWMQAAVERYRGGYARATELYTAGIALAQQIGRTDLALTALYGLGMMAVRQCDPQQARALIEPNLPVWEALHDRLGLAKAKTVVATAALMQGDYERAIDTIDEIQAICHEAGFHSHDAFLIQMRGDVAYAQGQFTDARAHYERALVLCEDAFEPMVVTFSLRGVACCALRQGDLGAARQAIERAREICEATQEYWVRALLQHTAAELAWRSGDCALAEEHLHTGVQQMLRLGDQYAIAEALDLWAALLAVTARPAEAARLLGAAGALRRRIGAPVMPIDEERMQATVAACRSALGDEAFAAAFAVGEAQATAGLQQMVELALNNR
jgi:predicted ATPase/transcriptional regulator with XRE-family HTH domain